MSTTDDLKNHLANQGGQTLGAIVTWSLNRASIPRADFIAGFDRLGLNPATGRTPRPESLVRRAVIAAKTGRKHVLIRELKKTNEKIVWGIVDESIRLGGVDGAEADYSQRSRIAVNRINGDIDLEHESNDTARAIRDFYLDARANATTQDVSGALVKALLGTEKDLMLGGMRLAGSGGCYWVPAASLPVLRGLAEWVDTMGESQMTLFEVTGTGTNLKNASRAATKTIRDRCAEILAETRGFVATLRQADPKAELRDTIIKTRMRRFDQLRNQAGLYADILGDIQGELEAEITAARDAVLGLKEPAADEYAFDTEAA